MTIPRIRFSPRRTPRQALLRQGVDADAAALSPPAAPALPAGHASLHITLHEHLTLQDATEAPDLRALRCFRPGDPHFPPAAAHWREWCDGEGLFGDAAPLTYIGDPAPLFRPTLGLVCSAHCPGSILLETYRFIRSLAADGPTVIGGFHSPMERNCLETLLVHHVPVVYCPGRRLKTRSVPVAWRGALEERRLLLLSPFGEKQRRVDRMLAQQRNEFVGALAETLCVPYARPGGAVCALVRTALQRGKPVITFADPENSGIIALGAEACDAGELMRRYKTSA